MGWGVRGCFIIIVAGSGRLRGLDQEAAGRIQALRRLLPFPK